MGLRRYLKAAFLKQNCEGVSSPDRDSDNKFSQLISHLPRPRRRPDLSTSLKFLVFILQHVISLMESSSTTALLQNAIGATISGSAQLINAGHDVVLHGPLPAAGTSRLYNALIPLI